MRRLIFQQDRFFRFLGLVVIVGLGAIMGVVELRHIQAMSTTIGIAGFALLPLLIDLGLIGAAIVFWRRQVTGDELLRIAGWVVVGMVSIGLLATWTITHQNIRGRPFAHAGFVTVNNLSVGGFIGVVFGWYDVQRRRHRIVAELENERLETFVSVVSHDLRNPLTVAQGRLELAKAECTSDHFPDIESALDRCFALIDDLLTLAKAGEPVTNPESLSLADTIDECWRNVDTGPATLVMATERSIKADPVRVHQLLENLLRNAVEHGGDGVTITIGDLDGGFYVADDGPGIPDDDREHVFERGYSTRDDGTGFGLAIVERIAADHDWEIHVTESADGGARFEVTGVAGG